MEEGVGEGLKDVEEEEVWYHLKNVAGSSRYDDTINAESRVQQQHKRYLERRHEQQHHQHGGPTAKRRKIGTNEPPDHKPLPRRTLSSTAVDDDRQPAQSGESSGPVCFAASTSSAFVIYTNSKMGTPPCTRPCVGASDDDNLETRHCESFGKFGDSGVPNDCATEDDSRNAWNLARDGSVAGELPLWDDLDDTARGRMKDDLKAPLELPPPPPTPDRGFVPQVSASSSSSPMQIFDEDGGGQVRRESDALSFGELGALQYAVEGGGKEDSERRRPHDGEAT